MDLGLEAKVVDLMTEELLSPFLGCERPAETGCSSSSESDGHLHLLPTDNPAVLGLALPDTLEVSEETRPPSHCFPFTEPLDPLTDRDADGTPAGPELTLPLVVRAR